MKRMTAKVSRLGLLVTAACLVVSGCSNVEKTDSGPAKATSFTSGLVNVADTPAEATEGGTLRVGLFLFPSSLDPAKFTDEPVLNAIYGTLMREDPETTEIVPQMAQSISSSDGDRTWTLQLRPGVTFTDGAAYDAKAVVASMKRMARIGTAATAAGYMSIIDSYETPDELTVVFHLKKGWARFPYLLTGGSGMIVSPNMGDDTTEAIGAGPFTLQELRPDESIILAANEDYWAGRPHLDQIVCGTVATPAAQVSQLKNGEKDVITLRDPKLIASLLEQGQPAYVSVQHGHGFMPNMNQGHPTADPVVRQAIAHAINVDQLGERVSNGLGIYHRTLIPQDSLLDPGVEALEFDPAASTELLEGLRAEGDWDGSLTMLTDGTSPVQLANARTVEAQLESAGFDVTLEVASSINDLIRRVFVTMDYDLVSWGLTMPEAEPWTTLDGNLGSESLANAYGYNSPDFDAVMDKLRGAKSLEDRRAVLGELQTLWNVEQPLILTHSVPQATFWSDQVHAVEPQANGWLLFGRAFIAS